jgi:hypothetical protein
MNKNFLFLLFLILCCFCSINANAQTEQVNLTIIFNDGTQTEHILSDTGKIVFSNSSIVILDDTDFPFPYPLASIRKMLVSNYVSIDKSEIENIKIYPNPVQDFLQIQNPIHDNMRAEIFSISGKSLYKAEFEGDKQIDISSLLSGTYLIKINNTFYKFTKI